MVQRKLPDVKESALEKGELAERDFSVKARSTDSFK